LHDANEINLLLMTKPLILITNDDGVHAPGLRMLIKVMRQLGDVLIVAPDKPMSGMGHEYSCSGTPVDCVKLGQKAILGRKPDLVVSGINHGSNASVNVIYSGTMAAVIEGALENIPSIGFSLDDYSHAADFSDSEPYVRSIAENVLKNGLPEYTCLNVNIPAMNGSPIKGIKIVRQAMAFWEEKFDQRQDPHMRDYFWLTGVFKNHDKGEDTDEWALRNNYVAVVPIHFDLTSHKTIPLLKNWETGNLN
jgi:5'-nucleotidase